VHNILIVGAGIVGSALYRELTQHGHNVDIIEKQPYLTCEGAAICLPANAMLELQKLGLDKAVKSHAHQVHAIEYALSDGQTLAKEKLTEAPLDCAPFVALPRFQLVNILRQGIESDIKLGNWLQSLTTNKHQTVVRFNQGQERTYDLVIGADGINSQVRELAFPQSQLRKSHVSNWRFIASMDTRKIHPTYYVGNDSAFMIYPISDKQVYCYGQIIDKKEEYYQLPSRQALQQIFSDYVPQVQICVNSLSNDDVIVKGELKSVTQTKAVHQRVVLIGDALHGCPPSLQQGVGLGLEDVNCLSALLTQHDIDEALKKFEDKRRKRIAWVVKESNKIIKLAAMGRSPFGRWVRNYMIRKKGPANVSGWKKLLNQAPY